MKQVKKTKADEIVQGMWEALQFTLLRVMMGNKHCVQALVMNMQPSWSNEQMLDFVEEVCFLLALPNQRDRADYLHRFKRPMTEHARVAAEQVERVLNMNAFLPKK